MDCLICNIFVVVPSPPINLEALEVTNNSIVISWNRPLEINGPSLDYQVWFNDKMVNIDTGNTVENSTALRLENLASFTNYTISVLACTNNCSVAGNTLEMRTSIGGIQLENSTVIAIFTCLLHFSSRNNASTRNHAVE